MNYYQKEAVLKILGILRYGKKMEIFIQLLLVEVKMVVEGVYSAKAALKLAEKYHVTMPIVEQVNEVLFDGKSAKDALAELMLRDKRMENTCLVWDKE